MTIDRPDQTEKNYLAPAFLIVAAIGLLFLAARSPLERDQEARVLETAREMVHAPLSQWMVPKINGEIRVQKPPLAYWLSACSMKLFGETVFAGRLPFVLVVIATLGCIYRHGVKYFSPATGHLAMWMTLGTTLYGSYGILAETDAISVLFVSAGIFSIHRCADAATLRSRVFHSTVAGLFAGLAGMAKGPPAFFIPLYALALSLFERKWRPSFDFAALGGLVVMALIAAPWWLMVARNPQYSIVLDEELKRMQTGSNHGKPFWHAFLLAGSACVPYIALAIGMIGGFRWNSSIRRYVIWFGIVMLSLTLTPQKQDHYFFQIVPPVMLLLADFLVHGLLDETRSSKTHRIAIGAMAITAMGFALASPVFVVVGSRSGRGLMSVDFEFTVLIALAFGALTMRYFKKEKNVHATVFLTLLISAIAMQMIMHKWAPTLRTSFRDIAADMRKDKLDQSVVFYPQGNNRMVFELGKIIPVAKDQETLKRMLEKNPNMSVIIEKNAKDFEIPDFIDPKLEYPKRGKGMVIGQLKAQ